MLYNLFVDIANLHLVAMHVQAVHMSHYSNYAFCFQKLKSKYPGVGDGDLMAFVFVFWDMGERQL